MINYCQVSDVFQRKIDNNLCLLKNKGKFVYKLNGTGEFLWELLKDKCSDKDLSEALSKKYKISLSQAKKDVEAFLKYHLKEGLIKKV